MTISACHNSCSGGLSMIKSVITPLVLAAGFLGLPAFADEKSEATSVVSVESEFVGPAAPLDWYAGFASTQAEPEDGLIVSAPIESDTFALNWNGSGRWKLTLDVTRRSENPILPEEEIAAGAYFQVTPRFRFGGGISFSGEDVMTDTSKWMGDDDNGEANVRIESAFSF